MTLLSASMHTSNSKLDRGMLALVVERTGPYQQTQHRQCSTGAASALLKLQMRLELQSRDTSRQAADSFAGSACVQVDCLHRYLTSSAPKASAVAACSMLVVVGRSDNGEGSKPGSHNTLKWSAGYAWAGQHVTSASPLTAPPTCSIAHQPPMRMCGGSWQWSSSCFDVAGPAPLSQ